MLTDAYRWRHTIYQLPAPLNNTPEPDVYWTLHHCDSWRIKNQLDATCYFILLLIDSTCFGHYYVHHQEFATVMLITTSVVLFLVCCVLEVMCGSGWIVSGLQSAAWILLKPNRRLQPGYYSNWTAGCSLDTTQTEPQAAAWILLKPNHRLQPGYYSNWTAGCTLDTTQTEPQAAARILLKTNHT